MHKEDVRTGYRGRRWPRFVIVYVASGTGTYVEASGRELRVEAGQVIQMPAGEPLSLVPDPDGKWMEWFLDFDPAWADATARAVGLAMDEAVLTPGRLPEVEVRWGRLLSDLEKAPDDPRHASEALWIWSELHRAHRERALASPAGAELALMARALGERLESREPIEALLGLKSDDYERMRRTFRDRYGVSPGRHRILRRIEAAKAALLDPRKQVKEIAFALGYPDAMTFSKQFQRETGRSPRAFRKGFYPDDATL